MRRRRVERLIVRAETALADGNADEVREALEEARRLAPGVPQIAALEQALEAPPADLPLSVDLPLVVPESVVDSTSVEEPTTDGGVVLERPRKRWRGLAAAAAVLAMAAGAAAAWMYGGEVLSRDEVTPSAQPTQAVESTPPPATESPAVSAPPASVRIETVEAAPVDLRSEPAPSLPLPQPAPVQLAAAVGPPPAPQPAATSGAGLPSTAAREADPVPVSYAERTAPLPLLDVPASPTLAETRSMISVPQPDVKLTSRADAAPKPERATEAAAIVANEDAAVRGVLNKYATAYSHLDANAAQQVYPAVNRSALSRAFDSLASQQVSLERCSVDVRGAIAHATCAGSATWSPKIGNGGMRTDARNWTFQLAKAGTDWQIVSARVQNR